MTKTEFLKNVKRLLRGIVAQRGWLLKNHKGYVESDWASQELRNIGHAATTLVDAERAKAYLERKETALRFLIPSTNRKWHNQLRELIETSLN